MSSRFLRAAANAEAISAAAPTIATTMNPTNAGLIPNVSAACCTDSTKMWLTIATSTVTPASVARARPIGNIESPASPCDALANNSLCVLSENNMLSAYATISRTDRPTLKFWVNCSPGGRVRLRDRRRNQQADGGQEQQARLHAGADAVVFLLVILEAAKQQRDAEHEQRVGDDRAGHRRLHQHELPGAQGRERDHQLRQVAERRIEQAADRITGLGRHRLRGVTEQRRQRHDRQDRQCEQQRVRVVRELLGHEHHGHEDQQPQQLVVLDLREEHFHRWSLLHQHDDDRAPGGQQDVADRVGHRVAEHRQLAL